MSRLREARETAGLSQTQLAERAGVSRQMVGAIEAGRHLPRVDAGLALAAALATDVASLFPAPGLPVDVVSGVSPEEGSMIRIGRVGDLLVAAPSRIGSEGWDVADGMIEAGALASFGVRAPGFVVAGCEPGLEVLERLLREKGTGSISVATSSRSAIAALEARRVHAAVVHGPLGSISKAGVPNVDAYHLTSWRVGLAASSGFPASWWRGALSGTQDVIQREEGAGVQQAFEEALAGTAEVIGGPVVGTHLEAAQLAMATGMPAVTIEPAALAVGAAFHPLETHEAQIWVGPEWSRAQTVLQALDMIVDARFRRRLQSIGGYDLHDMGTRIT